MKKTVAIQGERGAFSEEAARKLLGRHVSVLPCESFEQMFRAVARGRATYALAPIENTLAGSVHQNYDLMLAHKLFIIGEVSLRIEHHLIGLRGTSLPKIREVYSHPVALDQCKKFFTQHRRLKRTPDYDTAGSVKMLVESGRTDAAAIASATAAEVYGAKILLRSVEDHKQNFTRFFLLARQPMLRRDANKTSIVFATKNVPGALFKCLSVFALREINLTRIESRPLVGRPWEYFFYIDFWGNVREARVKSALNHLGEIVTFLRVLGCYPRAE